MKLTVPDPNLSIVVPGGCNGKCDFCFWKTNKTSKCQGYTKKLQNALASLPKCFWQISLTGGEPCTSKSLRLVLKAIDKNRWRKVVLTTNGTDLKNALKMKEFGVVDHINISRHHYKDLENDAIFGTQMPSTMELVHAINGLNQRHGIDVTLNCVLTPKMKTKADVNEFIHFAHNIGASAISFRKKHGNLKPSVLERKYKNHKVIYHGECPVCMADTQLINGMKITWKKSVTEPSAAAKGLYEAIFHANGELTADWERKIPLIPKDIEWEEDYTTGLENRVYELETALQDLNDKFAEYEEEVVEVDWNKAQEKYLNKVLAGLSKASVSGSGGGCHGSRSGGC